MMAMLADRKAHRSTACFEELPGNRFDVSCRFDEEKGAVTSNIAEHTHLDLTRRKLE